MNIQNDEKKKRLSGAAIAGIGAGAGGVGVGMIDLRPKLNLKNAPHLGDSWEEMYKKVRHGDVIIGSGSTPAQTMHESIRGAKSSWNAMMKHYDDIKSGKKRAIAKASKLTELDPEKVVEIANKHKHKHLSALEAANKAISYPAIGSKAADPSHSHAEMFTSHGGLKRHKAGWGGTAEHGIAETGIANAFDEKGKRIKIKPSESGHFVIIRPKKDVSEYNQIAKLKGAKTATAEATKRMVGKYQTATGVWAVIKDAVLPKFNKSDAVKTVAEKHADRCIRGGVCSTLPASFSNVRVGGKSTMDTLPGDFLRSNSYEVVGTVGRAKVSTGEKIVSHIPRVIAKAGAGLAVGAATYGAVKGIGALMKKNQQNAGIVKKSAEDVVITPKTVSAKAAAIKRSMIQKTASLDRIRELAFIDELEQISA